VVDWTSAAATQEVTKDGLTLSSGTTYYFHVKTQNNASTWSDIGHSNGIMVDSQGPTNVGIDSITADSTSQLTVTSLAATDSVSGLHATPYWFAQTSANPGGSSSTDWQESTTFIDDGLSANTQYTYKVKAKDALGNESSYSAETSRYTLANQVTDISVANTTDASNYKLSLSWTDNGQSGLKIEQDTNCDGYETTVYDNAAANPASPYTINTSANTCYQFKISSYNGDGVLNTTSIPQTNQITTPPAQPQGLTHTSNTTDSITWDWNDVTAATGYKVYRSSDDQLLTTINDAQSQWIQDTLSANTQYTIYTRATNANGQGIASLTASAYTSANTPINVSHSDNSTSTITWTWETGGAQKDYNATSTDNDDSSGWTLNTFWQQIISAINYLYHIIVGARNDDLDQTPTASGSAYSGQGNVESISFSNVTSTSITATAQGSFANLNQDSSGIYFENITNSATPGWLQTNSWTNSSLSANTQYTYRAKACNGNSDETSWSSEFTKYTLANAPGTPAISNITISSLDLTINQNSNATTTQYAVYEQNTASKYLDSSNGLLNLDTPDWKTYSQWGGATGITVNNLNENTTYGFKVKAKNQEDTETDYSTAATGLTLSTPNAPSLLGPTVYTNSSWTNDNTPTLQFTQSDANTSDTLKYRLQIDDTDNFSSPIIDYTSALITQGTVSFTVGQAAGSGTYATGSEAQTLTDNSYYWRVMSTDSNDLASSWTTANSGSIAFKVDTAAPTNIGIASIAADSSTQLTVTSQTAADSASGLHTTPYWFAQTSSNSGGSSSTDWQISTSFIDSGLSPNTQYTYKVKARDAANNESSYSAQTSQYTLANIPSLPTATTDSQTQITLSWNANNNPANTEYYAQNQTSNTNSDWITSTSHQFTDLTCNTSYTFRVKARNHDNTQTEYSDTASATTSACDQEGGEEEQEEDEEEEQQQNQPPTSTSISGQFIKLGITSQQNQTPVLAPAITPTPSLIPGIEQITANISQPLQEAINQAGETISQITQTLFPPKETPTPQLTAEQIAHEPTPPPLTGEYDLLPLSVSDFALAPLPEEFQMLQQKFPEIGQTFAQVGISKFADISKMLNTQLSLPGLMEVVGLTGAQIGGQGLSLTQLPEQLKQKIPSDYVFASISGNLDLNAKLKLTGSGTLEQVIYTIVRKPVHLTIKTDKPAQSVRGYLIAKGTLTQKNQQGLLAYAKSLLASVASAVGINNPQPEKLLLQDFDYTDPDADGIYEADIFAPAVKGNYEIMTVIKYQDAQEERREMNLTLIVDPEGYIYRKSGLEETRIPDAQISLYWLNPQTNEYELWPAHNFRQQNPQTTDQTGNYSFLAPPGKYFVKVVAEGYNNYEGQIFEITEGYGIHENIELKPDHWSWRNFDWKFWAVIFVLLVFTITQIINIVVTIKNKNINKK